MGGLMQLETEYSMLLVAQKLKQVHGKFMLGLKIVSAVKTDERDDYLRNKIQHINAVVRVGGPFNHSDRDTHHLNLSIIFHFFRKHIYLQTCMHASSVMEPLQQCDLDRLGLMARMGIEIISKEALEYFCAFMLAWEDI